MKTMSKSEFIEYYEALGYTQHIFNDPDFKKNAHNPVAWCMNHVVHPYKFKFGTEVIKDQAEKVVQYLRQSAPELFKDFEFRMLTTIGIAPFDSSIYNSDIFARKPQSSRSTPRSGGMSPIVRTTEYSPKLNSCSAVPNSCIILEYSDARCAAVIGNDFIPNLNIWYRDVELEFITFKHEFVTIDGVRNKYFKFQMIIEMEPLLAMLPD